MTEDRGTCDGCGDVGLLKRISTKKLPHTMRLCRECRKPERIIEIRAAVLRLDSER